MEFAYPPLREALVLLVPVLVIAVWVSWSDLKFMKIPNRAVIAMAGVWVVLGWPAVGLEPWLWGFALMAGVLVAGFLGNLLHLFGAGDAKFAAAMAGVFTGGDIGFIILLYAACSIAALVLHKVAKSIPAIRRRTPDWASWDRSHLFPMGTALSMMLVVYLLAAFLPHL